MSLPFLPEHAAQARFALDLAQRECVHLKFTHQRLFLVTPTLDWVKELPKNQLDAVLTADDACNMLYDTVARVAAWADSNKLMPDVANT